jgi:hypothetical protein
MRTLHIADPDCPETKTGYVTTRPAGLTCAADHPAEPVRWLWQHRIPLGKVTLHAGDPGLGKSLLALDIAARVTRGANFPTPGGTPGASSDGRDRTLNPSRIPIPSPVTRPSTNSSKNSAPNSPPPKPPPPQLAAAGTTRILPTRHLALYLPLTLIRSPQPRPQRQLTGTNLVLTEVQRNLPRRRLRTVRGVHQIHLPTRAEVAPDRARRRLESARRAQHLAHDANRFQPFDDGRHDRTARDEALQRRVPTLLNVLRIMLLCQLRRHPHHLHGDDIETLVLEPRDHAPHQPPLHTIRLQ